MILHVFLTFITLLGWPHPAQPAEHNAIVNVVRNYHWVPQPSKVHCRPQAKRNASNWWCVARPDGSAPYKEDPLALIPIYFVKVRFTGRYTVQWYGYLYQETFSQ